MKSRNIDFSQSALADLSDLIRTKPRLAAKLTDLLEECTKNPFQGTGKPEPLKGDLKGYWSRRIDQEHRLVYRVDDNYVYVYSCKGHYE